jgi:L-amino acid N-acyltransferase YncA
MFAILSVVTAGGDTYPYPPGLAEAEARQIWMAPTNTVFVADLDDQVVGTAYLRTNTVGLGDHICNAGWMVTPTQQGKGIGRRFAEHVISEAKRMGYRAMQFNAVVATNPAVRLWESLGFEIVGTVPDAFRHSREGLTPVHIMYRRL